MKNYGFQSYNVFITSEHHRFSGVAPVLKEDGQYDDFLPVYEAQADKYETQGCTVWGGQNQTEILLKFLTGTEFNFAELYNYTLAKVNPFRGANPQDVYDSFHNDGLIDQHFLTLPETFDEFLTLISKPIDPTLLAEGQKFLDEHYLWHEWVLEGGETREQAKAILQQALKTRGPIGVAVSAWFPKDDIYIDAGRPNNHWCVCYGWTDKGWKIFDSYDHSTKIYSFDSVISVAKSIYFTKRPDKKIIISVFDMLKANNLLAYFADWFKKTFMPPEIKAIEPAIAKKDYLTPMAEAIQLFEGWAAPGEKDRTGKLYPQGSHSWRHNNPGNLKMTNGAFFDYSSYEVGFAALIKYLTRACIGDHKAYKPENSIDQFFHIYAPDPEPAPTNYASFVCNYMSDKLQEPIFPSKQLKDLV